MSVDFHAPGLSKGDQNSVFKFELFPLSEWEIKRGASPFFRGNLSVPTFSKYWGDSDGKITEVGAIFKMSLGATFQWIGRNC